MPAVSSHDRTAPLPSDLSKLNVAQLKALCKERRIVGYSKLGKAALLAKLGDLTPSSPQSSSAQSTRCKKQADPLSSKSGSSRPPLDDLPAVPVAEPRVMGPPAPITPLGPNTLPGMHIPQNSVTLASISTLQSTPCPSEERGKSLFPSKSAQSTPVSKRVSSEVSQGPSQASADPLAKRPRLMVVAPLARQADDAALRFPNSTRLGNDRGVLDLLVPALPGSALVPRNKEEVGRQLDSRTQTVVTSGKRFKPLTTMQSPAVMPSNRKEARLSSYSLVDRSSDSLMAHPTLLWHLDFPPPPEPPLLSAITFPPPLSQRKLIQRWGIILSGLSFKERRQCSLVSKLIRYAVYSSAYYNLSRDFSGRRLSVVFQQCGSALTINFWPYLRQREQEVSERRKAVMSSFLRPAFQGPTDIISGRLWSSPENEKQLTVALRFLLTRLWFALSAATECGRAIWSGLLHDTITDVMEIIKGEIWCVTTRNAISGYVQAFYVLEATCEVLGLAGGGDENLRLDWAGYIEQRKTNPHSTSSLCDAMRWADHGEFERGISRHWLRRTSQMGAQGTALRTIAERYTLACVVGNSLSGKWMSAPQMAQEFAGLSQRTTSAAPAKAPTVNLFLPAHHHVESVHLTATGGRPLHPALAVVRTPSREYYVLSDNGLEVGCEEEGVASVWMRVLGCDARGEPDGRAGVNFEELRAYIQNL